MSVWERVLVSPSEHAWSGPWISGLEFGLTSVVESSFLIFLLSETFFKSIPINSFSLLSTLNVMFRTFVLETFVRWIAAENTIIIHQKQLFNHLRFLVWCSSISHLIPPNFGIEDPVLDDNDRIGDLDLGLFVLLTTWILEPFLLTAAVTGDLRSLKWR